MINKYEHLVGAKQALASMYLLAKKSIIIINDTIGLYDLRHLNVVGPRIHITVIGEQFGTTVKAEEIKHFKENHPKMDIEFKNISGKKHNQLIVTDFNEDDDSDEHIFMTSPQLNSIGDNYYMTMTELHDKDVFNVSIKKTMEVSTII